jgi:hypothetical protein
MRKEALGLMIFAALAIACLLGIPSRSGAG